MIDLKAIRERAELLLVAWGRHDAIPRARDIITNDLFALLAEVERLRAALEDLADGMCDATYGPGCNMKCKARAWRALEGDPK